MDWIEATTLPNVSQQDIYSPLSSGPVLVHRKGGRRCVARYESWDKDEPAFRWVTDCSEQWDITGEVTHWMPLPAAPTAKKELVASDLALFLSYTYQRGILDSLSVPDGAEKERLVEQLGKENVSKWKSAAQAFLSRWQ